MAGEVDIEENSLFRHKFAYKGLSAPSLSKPDLAEDAQTEGMGSDRLSSALTGEATWALPKPTEFQRTLTEAHPEEAEDEQWKVKIPENSRWGRLGVHGITNEYFQCESLLRAEDDFLSLKMEDDPLIRRKLETSRSIRATYAGTYHQITQEVAQQQQEIAKLTSPQKADDIKPSETLQQVDFIPHSSIHASTFHSEYEAFFDATEDGDDEFFDAVEELPVIT